MIWSQLREGLMHRRDVGAVCRRYDYDSVGQLLDEATDDVVADRLAHELVTARPVGLEIALAVLAPWLRPAGQRTLERHRSPPAHRDPGPHRAAVGAGGGRRGIGPHGVDASCTPPSWSPPTTSPWRWPPASGPSTPM